jgi:hypothetical protein
MLTGIKVGGTNIAEFSAVLLIDGATIDTLLGGAQRAMIITKMPRGMEYA